MIYDDVIKGKLEIDPIFRAKLEENLQFRLSCHNCNYYSFPCLNCADYVYQPLEHDGCGNEYYPQDPYYEELERQRICLEKSKIFITTSFENQLSDILRMKFELIS